jgi:DNA invertase Pin-like site-specific DNA recombinase
MLAHYGKFVSYYRVSTDRQGRSGLGLDAQKEAMEQRLNGGRWQLVAEFVEIESGKRAKRPQLDAALAACWLKSKGLSLLPLPPQVVIAVRIRSEKPG